MLLTRVCLLILMLLPGSVVMAAGDPTRPPLYNSNRVAPVYEPLKLTMILKDSTSLRAVINESVVSVTDEVAGARVLAINASSVLVRRAGQNMTLRLPVAAVRKEYGNE